ncbi:MAG: hypothetical protein AB7I48_18510 [Planctomycetaceae bacterium]
MPSLTVGGTFHFNDRPGNNHRYVIVSSLAAPEVVIVNMTTLKPWKDRSCIIKAGEHPFAEHDTCISYRHAEVVPTTVLQRKEQFGDIAVKEPMSAALLDRIWDGAASTQFLSLRCLQILKTQGLIP